jgi:hypothetical protein
MANNPTFNSKPPSTEMLQFIARIETSDPNSTELAEDDSNASWGHYQFTAGSMTVQSVLTSWSSVGNTETACKLIAAAIKTCKVARFICFQRNIAGDIYLSDIYLENIVDRLWTLWKDAGGVRSDANTGATKGVDSAQSGPSERLQVKLLNPHIVCNLLSVL